MTLAVELATKADIAALQRDMKELETALRRDVKELETALKREIVASSDKVTIRLGGMLVVGIAALAAVVEFL